MATRASVLRSLQFVEVLAAMWRCFGGIRAAPRGPPLERGERWGAVDAPTPLNEYSADAFGFLDRGGDILDISRVRGRLREAKRQETEGWWSRAERQRASREQPQELHTRPGEGRYPAMIVRTSGGASVLD